MQFKMSFRKGEEKLEENHGERITESAGYIPAKIQIENMILAGKRLADYRSEMYDYESDEEDDDEMMDPTRRPGYDMVDAQRDAEMLERRIKNAKKSKKNVQEKEVHPEEKNQSGSEKEEHKKVEKTET
jgi:hypothetical protein